VKSADEVTWYAFLAMKKKAKYRIRNWSEYDASHKKRGSGAIWVSSEAVENWTTDELTGQSGASPTYTDLAIETMATVQAIYGLAGRQTQGFLQSLFIISVVASTNDVADSEALPDLLQNQGGLLPLITASLL
jgi:hypothetical protein